MCGIFGSKTLKTFNELYKANKQRGDFTTSYVKINPLSLYIRKAVTTTDDADLITPTQGQASYYLGHCQAPTSMTRETSNVNDMHPFIDGDFCVAHNGIITNEPLIRDFLHVYANKTVSSKVDSALIPALLQFHKGDIRKTMELVEGTCTMWIIDTTTKEFYITRQGASLFINSYGDFSSVKLDDTYYPVEDGTTLKYNSRDNNFDVLFKQEKSDFLFI